MTHIWNLPYPRNPFFCGREDQLEELRERGYRHKSTLALTGLGGIGKTQIVVEYLFRTAQQYQTILWLDASSRLSVSAGIESLTLEKQGFKDFWQWLDTQEPWVVVLDHLDDLTLLNHFIPRQRSSPPYQRNGHVLLTTRRHAVGHFSGALRVKPLETESAVCLLLRRAGLLEAQMSLDLVPDSLMRVASTGVHELGSVPLVLDQAGAALRETQGRLADLLASYRQHPTRLLSQRGPMVDQTHPTSMGEMLHEILPSLPASSLELLRLFASFPLGSAIPQQLLVPDGLHLKPSLQKLIADIIVFHQALGGLLRFSLLFQEVQTQRLFLYAPIQLLVRETLTARQRQYYQGVAEGLYLNEREYKNHD